MATYPIKVAPPFSRNLTDGSATEDALRQHPQEFFQGSDIVWVTVAACLVLQMIPAISMFYSGATDRSSTLTLLRMPVITAAFCTVQWYLWGYALTFSSSPDPTSSTSSWYGAQVQAMVFHGALVGPSGIEGGPKIPELLYAFYQGMFASFTPALVCGGVIKKFKVGRFLIFISLWTLLVYYPVARWTWSQHGFSSQHGVMDFAGGTAVHITSGTAVGTVVLLHEIEKHKWRIFQDGWAAIRQPKAATNFHAKVSRRRRTDDSEPSQSSGHPEGTSILLTPQGNGSANPHLTSHSADINNIAIQAEAAPRGPDPAAVANLAAPPDPSQDERNRHAAILTGDAPHSLNNLVLGTMLLWIGWLGFNGGSALGGNMRAVSACMSTHVAASSGGCVMLLLFWILEWAADKWKDQFDHFKDGSGVAKLSVVHFCDGAVVGLVAITPAAGYVPPWSAGCIGAIASASIFYLKSTSLQNLMRHDPLFVFLIHTGGGFIGMFLTGCFARQYVVGFDGYSTIPDRSVGERLAWQMADAFAGFGYSLGMTMGILLVMKAVHRVFSGDWKLLGDDKVDKLEAELEYRWVDESRKEV